MYLFRKSFYIDLKPIEYKIKVPADTRYIIYINGKRLGIGPCKTTVSNRIYEVYDIAPFLVVGKNTIAASVLHQPNDSWGAVHFETGSTSMLSTARGGFWVSDELGELQIMTNSSWKCLVDKSYQFVDSITSRYAGDMELVDGRLKEKAWNSTNYDDSFWLKPIEIADSEQVDFYGAVNNWILVERTIPLLYEKPIKFKKVVKGADVLSILASGNPFKIDSDAEFTVELDVGELMTAYFNLDILDGCGAKIDILYSESYYDHYSKEGVPLKGKRDNAKTGVLVGESDHYIAGEGKQTYEPYFFRTFRFIRMKIKTASDPLIITAINLRETGYPIDVKSNFETNIQTDKECFDISIRTLKRCMHETYEDCPFYEQMQYILDTMLQALFTYNVSGDIRLVEKAISDFKDSRRPDGMITCNSPSQIIQIIPGFSIYWIMMVKNHYMYYGDKAFLRKYIPVIEDLLNYFKSKTCNQTGLIADIGYWEFVDWVDMWIENWGSSMCKGEKYERYNYIYNMMYAYALGEFSFLCRELNRNDIANEYEESKNQLLKAIRKYAFDEKRKLFNYKPNAKDFSQHAQIWAVISGVSTGDEAKQLMTVCLNDDTLLKSSYSYSFLFFRALEKIGLYEKSGKLWDGWLALLQLGVTTWPEDPVLQRSECHGWSGVQLFEYPSCYLGVQPLLPGYEKVRIKPHIVGRTFAKGSVVTKHGLINVNWEINNSTFSIRVELPKVMNVQLVLPDGGVKDFLTDHISESCSL